MILGDIQASTRKELMKSIDDRLQKAIRNLENLGVELSVSFCVMYHVAWYLMGLLFCVVMSCVIV